MHARAGVGLAVELELTAETLHHDGVNGVQPKAGCALMTAGGEEWIECLPFDLRRHAAAVVSHDQRNMIGFRAIQSNINDPIAPVGKRMCHRIHGEVRQHLPEWSGIAIHRKVAFGAKAQRQAALVEFAAQMRQGLLGELGCIKIAPIRLIRVKRHLLE